MNKLRQQFIDLKNNSINGFFIEGEKKLFKKSEDVFVYLRQISTIGDDVILVKINELSKYKKSQKIQQMNLKNNQSDLIKYENKIRNKTFVRYKRIDNNKYK